MTDANQDRRPSAEATILVVDADILVRLAIADFLRDCGYRVFEAGSGTEAITILAGGHAVDVVLCDANLPGEPGGFSLARRIRHERPEIKVLLVGSNSSEVEVAADLCDEGPMLGRPYEPQLVLDRIRRLMGGQDAWKPRRGVEGAEVCPPLQYRAVTAAVAGTLPTAFRTAGATTVP